MSRTIQCTIGSIRHGTTLSHGAAVHDWEVVVEITKGDVNLVRKVVFKITCGRRMLTYVSACPMKSGSSWRFQVRRQTEGRPVRLCVIVVGHRNATLRRYVRMASYGSKWSRSYRFRGRKSTAPIRPNAIAQCNFGIELELSTSSHVSADEVAKVLKSYTSIHVKDLTEDFARAKRTTDIWRLMTDSSISCPRGGECSKFELVSPVLTGGSGISEVHKVLKALGTISSVEVGKSMGFHVHIDVSNFSCKELARVCRNFLRYERAMDSFMPPSRREDIQQYCRSNEKAVESAALSNCETLTELADVMNPGGHPSVARYYKLNLQNLVTGRQPTIEFRQHSGTSNVFKIKNWIRFCVAFVHNSADLDDASQVETATDDQLFEMLMVNVINDRYLRDFYRKRRNELHKDHHGEEGGSCCEGCAARGRCAAKFLPV